MLPRRTFRDAFSRLMEEWFPHRPSVRPPFIPWVRDGDARALRADFGAAKFAKTQRAHESARKLERDSTSILSQGTSQFLPKLAKLVYTARQVVSWQGRRYNDELDVNGIYAASTCLRLCWEEHDEEEEEGTVAADALRYGSFGGPLTRHVTEHRFWPVGADEHSEYCGFSARSDSIGFSRTTPFDVRVSGSRNYAHSRPSFG